MVPKDYTEVSEGVYESDAFVTSRPKIDTARVRQILNEQRPAAVDTDEGSASLQDIKNSATPARDSKDVVHTSETAGV